VVATATLAGKFSFTLGSHFQFRIPSLIEQVSAQIDRFSGLYFQWLSFPAPLDARFEADTRARRSTRLAFEGIFALILFDLFLIADRLVSDVTFDRALVVRLGIVTPIGILINLRMWRNPGAFFREASIATLTCTAGLAHLYLERGQTDVNSAYAQVGLIATIVFANTLVRMRFVYAIATSVILIAGDLVFLRFDTLLLPRQKIVGLSLALITVTVTLIANYSFNREERLNYLIGLRGELMVKDLHHSNERLADVAERDALTGLANRAGFDVRFLHLWQEALDSQTPFSVIMVDVDRFKQTNDNYGHLYGDKVLKRIANLVLEALRREGDHAARFGGEEFVILLPDTDEPAAMLVAERLRRLVEVAGFPPIETSRFTFGSIVATVSCGVATTIPRTMEERHQLVNAADKALYEAKTAGRNRVCCSMYKGQSIRRGPSSPTVTIAKVS
jgi:diguanylate cyclase (GGDEF)-like protein